MSITISNEVRLRLYIWATLGIGLLVDMIGLSMENITFEFGAAWQVFRSAACLTSFSLLYALAFVAARRWQRAFLATCFYRCAVYIEAVLQFIVFFIIYGILSYIAAASNMPFQDGAFAYADAFLHLDWYSYVAWVESHEHVRRVLTFGYHSPMPQVLVAFMLLAVAGQYKKASRVMLALILSAVACIVISALVPAKGFITYGHINPADFPHLREQLKVGYVQVPIILALRAGSFHVLQLTQGVGLVSFPSFHTCFGVILMWAFWSLPWICWPIVALNLCEIAATPVIGGHYFVDTISGVFIAMSTIYVVGLLGREREGSPIMDTASNASPA